MYRITKDIKRFSTILILIGVVAISYGFFQSLTTTSDDEIKYTVKKIAKELDLKLKAKLENEKYNDVGYLMDENDEVIFKSGDKIKYEDGTKKVINEINTDGEGGYSLSTKKDKKLDYSELIYKVEKKLNCSIDSSHIHSVEDVIYSSRKKHYFHAKKPENLVKPSYIDSFLSYDFCSCNTLVGLAICCSSWLVCASFKSSNGYYIFYSLWSIYFNFYSCYRWYAGIIHFIGWQKVLIIL